MDFSLRSKWRITPHSDFIWDLSYKGRFFHNKSFRRSEAAEKSINVDRWISLCGRNDILLVNSHSDFVGIASSPMKSGCVEFAPLWGAGERSETEGVNPHHRKRFPSTLGRLFFIKNKLENKKKKCIVTFEHIFSMQKFNT